MKAASAAQHKWSLLQGTITGSNPAIFTITSGTDVTNGTVTICLQPGLVPYVAIQVFVNAELQG